MNHPEQYSDRGRAMVIDWLDTLGNSFGSSSSSPSEEARAITTLVIAAIRGLMLDRLTTRENGRTDEALDRFTRFLDQ